MMMFIRRNHLKTSKSFEILYLNFILQNFYLFYRTSPGESDSCQLMSRKKRRGVIEKKRRDRINLSLSELKRLVPSAYEKQGSAKLEKAEILQLTVEHLKTLNSKGKFHLMLFYCAVVCVKVKIIAQNRLSQVYLFIYVQSVD